MPRTWASRVQSGAAMTYNQQLPSREQLAEAVFLLTDKDMSISEYQNKLWEYITKYEQSPSDAATICAQYVLDNHEELK